MAKLKLAEMTNAQLLHTILSFWARGRKNVDEVKAEILSRFPDEPEYESGR